MADNDASAGEPGPPVEKPSGLLSLVVAMLITTVISGVGGGVFGLYANGKSNHAPEPSKKTPKHADDTKRPFSGDVNLKSLASIVTNLGGPRGTWVRLEAAIVLGPDAAKEEGLLAGRISEDIIAFLRTVPLAQIEGANGFQNLREDLNDRARIRSEGKVREVIIQSLIVE
jgi:flagellar FliL protein